MYAKDVKLLTLRNSFISVMIKWLPFVLYLNSSVILSAIYNTLCRSMASHPFRNSNNAPKKINPAIKMLNNMIVGWSAMKMTSLLRYLSWFSSAMRKQQQQHAIGHREPQCVLIPPFITGTNLCPQCRNNLM